MMTQNLKNSPILRHIFPLWQWATYFLPLKAALCQNWRYLHLRYYYRLSGSAKPKYITKQDVCTLSRATPSSVENSTKWRWWGTNYFSEYCCPSKSKTGLCIKLYTCGLDRKRARATSAVKSNYFQFATKNLNFTHEAQNSTSCITSCHDIMYVSGSYPNMPFPTLSFSSLTSWRFRSPSF